MQCFIINSMWTAKMKSEHSKWIIERLVSRKKRTKRHVSLSGWLFVWKFQTISLNPTINDYFDFLNGQMDFSHKPSNAVSFANFFFLFFFNWKIVNVNTQHTVLITSIFFGGLSLSRLCEMSHTKHSIPFTFVFNSILIFTI